VLISKVQIVEMLAFFSSSLDETMSLADFEQMMVATGMI